MTTLSGSPGPAMRAEACRILARMREATGACFGNGFATTLRLDMLAELYLAECEDRALHAWTLCLALQAAPSTAHRKIGELERCGLVSSRRGAASDSNGSATRRDNRYRRVRLTPEGREKTCRLLDQLLQIWSGTGRQDPTGMMP